MRAHILSDWWSIQDSLEVSSNFPPCHLIILLHSPSIVLAIELISYLTFKFKITLAGRFCSFFFFFAYRRTFNTCIMPPVGTKNKPRTSTSSDNVWSLPYAGKGFFNLYGLPTLGQNLTDYYGLINDKNAKNPWVLATRLHPWLCLLHRNIWTNFAVALKDWLPDQ
jgi:hypothetical protein